MSKNQVIGRNGELPWRLRTDLIRFKRITMGHTLIMGRKTFESIGRVLPGRRTVVISRKMLATEGIEIARSLPAAISLAHRDSEPFVVGGGEIYQLALPMADRLHLTRVDAEIDGETYFPTIDFQHFQLRQRELIPAGPGDEYPHSYEMWDRVEINEVRAS